ncbi:MAG: Death on curing protein, Doc toxin, partial [uncultured Quadrisphaera sp.]
EAAARHPRAALGPWRTLAAVPSAGPGDGRSQRPRRLRGHSVGDRHQGGSRQAGAHRGGAHVGALADRGDGRRLLADQPGPRARGGRPPAAPPRSLRPDPHRPGQDDRRVTGDGRRRLRGLRRRCGAGV